MFASLDNLTTKILMLPGQNAIWVISAEAFTEIDYSPLDSCDTTKTIGRGLRLALVVLHEIIFGR